MKEKETEINVLDELNKGACMGRDAIHFVLDKVTDESFREELNDQYMKYKSISDKICELYPEYANSNEDDPHETTMMTKIRTWYGIEMKTMMDDSTSKLAELIMQGVNMGIIEGRRLLNHKHSDEQVEELLREYVNMQEQSVENLKKFL